MTFTSLTIAATLRIRMQSSVVYTMFTLTFALLILRVEDLTLGAAELVRLLRQKSM